MGEVWTASLPTQFRIKNVILIFITSHQSFEYHGIYYTNTTSNLITGIYWLHKTTLYYNKSSHICHQWHSSVCKMLHQTLGAPRPSTQ